MAQIEGSSSGKKINVDLNIVPFIDLMCVCVIFLLVTAVWAQVSMIQIGSSVYSKRTEATPEEIPPRPEVAFRLDLKSQGFVVYIGKKEISIPKIAGAWDDQALNRELKAIKQEYPEKKDGVVAVQDELTYDDMIHGMDLLLAAGFDEIAVATGGAN